MASMSRAVSVLMLAGYAGIALGVENLYPFSTFPMYSDWNLDSGSRLIVLGDDDVPREVKEFDAWTCPDLRPVEKAMCSDGEESIPAGYLVKEAYDYIGKHPPSNIDDPNRIEVDIVLRTWRLTPGKADVEILNCPIQQCRARLK